MATVREQIADGRRAGAFTREDIIEALGEYAARYGPDFGSAAFNPANARWAGRPDLIERYRAGREDGRPWPSLNAMKKATGLSFTELREAAGLPANKPGPRRTAGTAAPILDMRVERVVVPSDRDRELTTKINRLSDALLRARERASRAEATVVAVRKHVPAQRVVHERVEKPTTRTITKVKEVKVRDERALERLRAKLADEQAARRAVEDQIKSERRDHDRAGRDVAQAQALAAQAAAESRALQSAANRTSDRLAAAEDRVERLRGELANVQVDAADVRERALAADLVQAAERRVEAAEVRAARAERQMVEQASAITGEPRRLTAAEMAELKTKGPAGETVLARALRKLATARAGRGNLDAALVEVARAALTWRDRLT